MQRKNLQTLYKPNRAGIFSFPDQANQTITKIALSEISTTINYKISQLHNQTHKKSIGIVSHVGQMANIPDRSNRMLETVFSPH